MKLMHELGKRAIIGIVVSLSLTAIFMSAFSVVELIAIQISGMTEQVVNWLGPGGVLLVIISCIGAGIGMLSIQVEP